MLTFDISFFTDFFGDFGGSMDNILTGSTASFLWGKGGGGLGGGTLDDLRPDFLDTCGRRSLSNNRPRFAIVI